MPASFIRYEPRKGDIVLAQQRPGFNVWGVYCAYCGLPRSISQTVGWGYPVLDREGSALFQRHRCAGCGSPIFRRVGQ